jgi:hypothetical protein
VLQLPHSKIDLGIPMFGFRMADIPSHIEHGQGIRPDYTIVPTIEDILNQKDPVMDYTRQLINRKSARPAAKSLSNN